MRNFQKQQLLDIITSLHMLHQESQDKLEKKDYPTVRTALSDCQEAAIQIGEAIEKMAGTGTEAVSYLEKYCEKLYKISLQLEEILGQKFYKSLEGILIKAENAINHIPIRKEIVFLPYKASMWDSLESVYLAAREDADCDAYVVPIPYYDRKADGRLGELHYEGNEYPGNIDITDYREYNLEERHPDVIYIHNPYDNWNNVTCVPEYYFCNNIREYTDCLVYIPYFVLEEIEPENQKAIDNMKHFCFLPGVIFAHRVIVQSDKMRRIYINEYMKEAHRLGFPADRKVLEDKIKGLGSPKFDKVQEVKKEALEIPDEWLKIIKKPDGTWKKIVFYNTSINALLRHDDRMLEKIKVVFEYFEKNKDEIALLWRPHPLIPNTIKSMRPRLWDKYEKIVEQYRQGNWGIYDDSADMDRAVVLSDAYYGDSSSIVYVYQQTGKPLLMQNVNVMPWNYANSFILSAMWHIEDNKAWFVDIKYNILYCIELDTNKCEFKAKIPYEGLSGYRRCIKCGDSVFCMPAKGKSILVYQCSSQKFSEIEIDNPDNVSLGINNFYLYEDRIFALSSGLKQLIEIDVNKKKIENYYSFDVDEVLEVVTLAGTTIFSLSNQSRQIIGFDMMNKETVSYMLPDIEKKFYQICFDGEKFWLGSYYKEVYIWNREANNIEVVGGFPEGFGIYKNVDNENGEDNILDCEADEYDVPTFSYAIAVGEYIWFIPSHTNKILYVDKNTYVIKEFEIEDEIETRLSIMTRNFAQGRYKLEYVRENRYIGLFSRKNRRIFEIDTKEMKVKRYNYNYSESCLREVKNIIAVDNTIHENDMFNIENYFSQFLEENILDNSLDYENAGLNIHKEIMKY